MVRRIPPSLLVQQPAPNPSTPTASRTESLSVGDTLKIPSIPGFKTSAGMEKKTLAPSPFLTSAMGPSKLQYGKKPRETDMRNFLPI